MARRDNRLVIYALHYGDDWYIGRSKCGMERPKRHLTESSYMRSDSLKNIWIRDLLSKGIEPNIILLDETAKDYEELRKLEKFYLCAAFKFGMSLKNSMIGDLDDDEEVIWLTPYSNNRPRLKREEVKIEKKPRPPQSMEQRQRHSAFMKGKKKSPETRKRMGEANSRREWKESSRVKTARTLGGRPFIDNLGRRWETNRQCARELGLYESNVRQALKGRLKTTGGYSFKYIEE